MLYLKPINDYNCYKDFAKKVYESAFPKYQCRGFENSILLQESSNSIFYVILDEENAVGFCVLWQFSEFTYIEHIAIDDVYRGKNYGSGVMESIVRDAATFVVLEVEHPSAGAVALKRINWYKRFGFYLMEQDFIMPAFVKSNPDVLLKIMANKLLSTSEYSHVSSILLSNVYSN